MRGTVQYSTTTSMGELNSTHPHHPPRPRRRCSAVARAGSPVVPGSALADATVQPPSPAASPETKMPKKVEPDPTALLADCETEPGDREAHTMTDGWKLYSETFAPDGEPTAMILHLHGWMENTQTLAVRRLAKMCKSRNILLVCYEMHGHGDSLEKNGVRRAVKTRGELEGVPVATNHHVEMAKIMLAKYKLPLIITGHSMGACITLLSTRRIVEACRAMGVPYITGVYLSPVLSITPPCCCYTWQVKCACAIFCCGGCCCARFPMETAPGLNPGDILGENRNQTHIRPWTYIWNCLAPPPDGSGSMATVLPEIDIGVSGKIFAATKEKEAAALLKPKVQAQLPATFSVHVLEGMVHE